jgi:hypothetical protein
MAMDAKQVGNLLAVAGMATRDHIQRLQALALLGVFLLFHALVQGVSALGNSRRPFPHLRSPSAAS